MQYYNLLSHRVGVHNWKYRTRIPEVVGQSVFDELFCVSPITRSNEFRPCKEATTVLSGFPVNLSLLMVSTHDKGRPNECALTNNLQFFAYVQLFLTSQQGVVGIKKYTFIITVIYYIIKKIHTQTVSLIRLI